MEEISAKYTSVKDGDEDEMDDAPPADDHPPRCFPQVRVTLTSLLTVFSEIDAS